MEQTRSNEQIIKLIQQNGMSADFISDLLENHSNIANDSKRAYQNYKSKSLPIQSRTLLDPNKINSKLNLSFRALIVDQGLGYAFGIPVTHEIKNTEISLNQDKYTEKEIFQANMLLKDFIIKTREHKKNLMQSVYSSTGGYSARLFYIDDTGNINYVVYPAWNSIFLNEFNDDSYEFGLIYYNDVNIQGEKIINVKYFDSKNVIEYEGKVENDKKDKTFKEIATKPSVFDYMPMIKFKNNLQELNDFHMIESLVDGIDKVVSDAQNEIEEQRLAYIVIQGTVDITKEIIRNARETGVFVIPDDAKIYYLEKSNNDGNIQNQYKILKDNIYNQSQSIDFTDDNFSGSGGSGEARKWKLLSLETRIGMKIVEFTGSLIQCWKIVFSGLNKKLEKPIDYFDVSNVFTRNLPIDLEYVAKYSKEMLGVYSKKTIYANSPIVDNPQQEIQDLEEENKMLDLEDQFGMNDVEATE